MLIGYTKIQLYLTVNVEVWTEVHLRSKDIRHSLVTHRNFADLSSTEFHSIRKDYPENIAKIPVTPLSTEFSAQIFMKILPTQRHYILNIIQCGRKT
jgi:hypothetical protein